MPTSINPLAIIAGGSSAAARMATDALRAQQNGSPMAAARAARAARFALGDSQATFTDAERRQIAELLENDRDAAPIRFRVTADERARLEQMAEDAELSISDFIRQKIGI
jgi:hypothetical protein